MLVYPESPSGAVISECSTYRYALSRSWSTAAPLVFLMLNPSTADAHQDDPTIRRCVGFAKRDGFGGILVVNLFAFRSTDPSKLRGAADPVGPDNDAAVQAAMSLAKRSESPVMAAWGKPSKGGRYVLDRVRSRSAVYANMARQVGVDLFALGTTEDGFPRHPLMLRADTMPAPYSAPPFFMEAA